MFKYEGNKFALRCCDVLLSGHAPFTALYIYGPSGCGKSAILNYIESESYVHNPNRKVIRVTEDISETLGLMESCKPNPGDEQLLMIDGIERLGFAARAQLSGELPRYLDVINNTKSKVIITSDRSIDALAELYKDTYCGEKFIGRLQWEMTARVDHTTAKERETALWEVAKGVCNINKNALESIIHMIVDAEGNSLGSSLATFRRIVVRAQFAGQLVTPEFAEKVIYENTDIELVSA